MNARLLDTTVLVDLSRGNQYAADFIDNSLATNYLLTISIISAAYGAPPNQVL